MEAEKGISVHMIYWEGACREAVKATGQGMGRARQRRPCLASAC